MNNQWLILRVVKAICLPVCIGFIPFDVVETLLSAEYHTFLTQCMKLSFERQPLNPLPEALFDVRSRLRMVFKSAYTDRVSFRFRF